MVTVIRYRIWSVLYCAFPWLAPAAVSSAKVRTPNATREQANCCLPIAYRVLLQPCCTCRHGSRVSGIRPSTGLSPDPGPVR
jgi:hypothetical protein